MLCCSTGPGWVSLAARTANVLSLRLAGKLGFTEVERFEEWGASSGRAPGHDRAAAMY
ncbi:hypothetical protein SGL43_02041 [Streptomyces globisporus]|uniref:GNAT family N-acetyltransferase n=1 Tax=Streptomyces globisporus TaxID=1908 RepID=A0ABN8UXF6_STRGL|nr:hypothetical protein SGL43_02041 [Streptomyces globisporus]